MKKKAKTPATPQLSAIFSAESIGFLTPEAVDLMRQITDPQDLNEALLAVGVEEAAIKAALMARAKTESQSLMMWFQGVAANPEEES